MKAEGNLGLFQCDFNSGQVGGEGGDIVSPNFLCKAFIPRIPKCSRGLSFYRKG